MPKVLFVCLGNICRSPMAEAVFKRFVMERGLSNEITADSAGTSRYHIGANPDHRTIACARNNATPIAHKARQVTAADHGQFDYIIVMDQQNLHDTLSILGQPHPGLSLMRSFDDVQESMEVPDPYFGGMEGFQEVYDILNRSCSRLLEHIIDQHQLQDR